MAMELFASEGHTCISFHDLVKGEGIQANQFLITHNDHSALIDPGGALTYTPLSMAVSRHIRLKDLDYIFASHQDPDIIASVDKWLMYTNCKVVVSKLWGRFVPHLVPSYMEHKSLDRYELLLDQGEDVPFGDSYIKCIPAHFLHSVGNFHFYDPVSKILFSGDVGASLVDGDPSHPVEDFDDHLKSMAAFHQRYMNSNKICRYWTNMIRGLDVEMIVPQHGQPFKGKAMVSRFLDWFGQLECGTDMMTQANYRLP